MNECFVSSGISGKRKERIRRDVITYSIERGLGADEVRRSALKYGKNTLEKKGRTSLTRRFLSNFGDPIIRILLAEFSPRYSSPRLFQRFSSTPHRARSSVSTRGAKNISASSAKEGLCGARRVISSSGTS